MYKCRLFWLWNYELTYHKILAWIQLFFAVAYMKKLSIGTRWNMWHHHPHKRARIYPNIFLGTCNRDAALNHPIGTENRMNKELHHRDLEINEKTRMFIIIYSFIDIIMQVIIAKKLTRIGNQNFPVSYICWPYIWIIYDTQWPYCSLHIRKSL